MSSGYRPGSPSALPRGNLYRVVESVRVGFFILVAWGVLVSASLASSSLALWRLRQSGAPRVLARAALIAQVVFCVFIVLAATERTYEPSFGLVLPASSVAWLLLVIMTLLVGGMVITTWARAGKTRFAAVAAFIAVVVLLPAVSVGLVASYGNVMARLVTLPTGQSLLVSSVACSSASHCVAESSNINLSTVPFDYLAASAGSVDAGRDWKLTDAPAGRDSTRAAATGVG